MTFALSVYYFFVLLLWGAAANLAIQVLLLIRDTWREYRRRLNWEHR